MKVFRDTKNRAWEVELPLGILARIKAYAGVDLLTFRDQQHAIDTFDKLAADPEALVNALWAVVKDQAERQRVTEADFGLSLGGSTIDDAITALIQEWADFFRSRGQTVKAAMADLFLEQMKLVAESQKDLPPIDIKATAKKLFGKPQPNSAPSLESETTSVSPSAN